ncbi:MAG TPA: hypothetical protein VMD97_04675 [Candidatus Aquilonibacter sp.]|nr:hypothetical protein [Candidatus Aquilonibacter sp.]
MSATGIQPLDALVQGGVPLGALTELVGPECSGRTSTALSFLAQLTQAEKVCAWVDVTNALDPFSAAAVGIDLKRLLWVRCGAAGKHAQTAKYDFKLPEKYLIPPTIKKGLHGGGFGGHPRHEIKGLSNAVGDLLQPHSIAPRCAEPQHHVRPQQQGAIPVTTLISDVHPQAVPKKPWSRMEQALRSTDLLLQAGGFGAIVLDMGGLAPEFVSRVPLATWFRYRAAAERTQTSILLLAQYACAKSSAELMLRLHPAEAICDETTVFTGVRPRVQLIRQRFNSPTNVIPMRKPPQRVNEAQWECRTLWAGAR